MLFRLLALTHLVLVNLHIEASSLTSLPLGSLLLDELLSVRRIGGDVIKSIHFYRGDWFWGSRVSEE